MSQHVLDYCLVHLLGKLPRSVVSSLHDGGGTLAGAEFGYLVKLFGVDLLRNTLREIHLIACHFVDVIISDVTVERDALAA